MSFEVILILLLALIFLAQWLDNLDREGKKRDAKAAQAAASASELKHYKDSLKNFLAAFSEDPFDVEAQQNVLHSMELQGNPGGTGLAYTVILASLANNPDAGILKQLALEAGRIHYDTMRGGETTLEDEQRIMNDIAVRT